MNLQKKNLKLHVYCFHNLMETFKLLTIFFSSLCFTLSLFTHRALSETNCQPSSCNPDGPEIRFPFRRSDWQDLRCGVPGFDLSCNNNHQTILTLPSAGKFIVTKIDYKRQWIYINDPDYCITQRVQSFNLSGSPFRGAFPTKITFLNCSLDVWYDYQPWSTDCLRSNHNYTVVASNSSDVPPGCRNMSTVSVPVHYYVYLYGQLKYLSYGLLLTWRIPGCESCEAEGGTCVFKDYKRTEIGCLFEDYNPGRDLYAVVKFVKFVIIIGVVLECCNRRRRQLDPELPNTSIPPQPAMDPP